MDNPIEANLSILPHEKLIEILLALDDLEDIASACHSSTIFARVCRDDYFWKLRYQQDFGSGRPSEEMFQEKMPLKPRITIDDSMQLKPRITIDDSMPWREFYQSTIEILYFPPLSAGYNHVGVIDRKGQLYMWGNNEEAQLGDGSHICTNVPQIVLPNVHQVSCSYGITGAVTKNGQVYTWGENYRGSLGVGYSDEGKILDTSVPMLVKLSKKVRKIDCGSSGSIVLTEDGEVYMWGQLTHLLYTEVPLKLNLPSKEKVIDVATGDFTFAAITKSGKLYMWGDNRHYLYMSKNWTNRPSGIYNLNDPDHRMLIQPTLIPFSEPIHQISMSDDHFGVVTKKGELWMAGSNNFNQIGEHVSIKKDVDEYKKLVKKSGEKGISFMPGLEKKFPTLIPIKLPSSVLYFNSRWTTSLVKLKDGRVLIWGNNKFGQIDSYGYERPTRGINTTPDVGDIIEPVEIRLDQPIVYIVVGGEFTVAITDDGYVNFWGADLALSSLSLI